MSTDEEKISSLYQQGKDQAPPAHIDNAILNAAREAVADSAKDKSSQDKSTADKSVAGRSATDKLTAVKSPFSGGWPVITSIAAVLIITVILVPLIDKETPPPATSRFADETQELMSQQDSFTRPALDKDDMEDRPAVKHEAKKRSKVEAPVLLRRERELLQAPQDAVSADILHAGKVVPLEKSTAEESMTTMGATIKPPAPARSAQPESATMKSTLSEDSERKLEAETKQRTSSGLIADKESSVILTASEWLKKIRQLIDRGDLNLAKQELDKFKIHYPDEEVDPLLLNQLNNQ